MVEGQSTLRGDADARFMHVVNDPETIRVREP
jgi:hypothetical protein